MARPTYDAKLRKVIFHSHKDYEDTLSTFTHFRGYYSFIADLPAVAVAGDFAVVGETDTMWVYDGDTSAWNDSDSSSGVLSFNGRLGVVVPATNDYTWAQINKTTSSLADITTRNYSDLQNIPSEFTPAAHNHSASDIVSGNLAATRLPVSGVWTVGDGATLEITGTMASRIKISCPVTMDSGIDSGVIVGVNEINGEKLLWGYHNIAMNQMPTGGTWTLTRPLNINDQDVVLNRRLQIFSSYSNLFELKNTSSVSLATFLVENNIGIARALKILNSGSAYAGTNFLNDYAGVAITEPNATCIANTYTGAPLYFGANDKAIGVLYNDYVGLGLFNTTDKPTSLLHLQPLRDATDNTVLKIGDTRTGNTSDAFRLSAHKDGGRLLIYNFGSAKIDLRAGGNSTISPAGYLTVNPANDLRVSSNTIFNYDYADRDFTIRKLTSGNALVYDAGLDKFSFSSHLENSEDIKVSNASKGLILIDRTTSNAYRLYINNGVLYQEAI